MESAAIAFKEGGGFVGRLHAAAEIATFLPRLHGGPKSLRDMNLLANAVVVFVALLHFYFLVLEMFLWTTPTGRRVFRISEDFARASRALAANQGLYNGFLAVALLWGVTLGTDGAGVRLFALGCVVVAGVYGAATVNKRILYVQAVPGLVGLVLTWLARAA